MYARKPEQIANRAVKVQLNGKWQTSNPAMDGNS
jgi:hypothetical protein